MCSSGFVLVVHHYQLVFHFNDCMQSLEALSFSWVAGRLEGKRERRLEGRGEEGRERRRGRGGE